MFEIEDLYELMKPERLAQKRFLEFAKGQSTESL